DPAGIYDFNHVYTDSGVALAAGTGAVPPAAPGGAPRAEGGERSATRIGLIDSGVDVTHEVFNGMTIQQHGCGIAVPAEHGTAVASLMVGRASAFHGAAPGSALYAADVFCGRPTGGAVDAVAEAFGWLAREHVPVINVSLVGPPNTMLAVIVQDVLSRGYLIVAAVGHDGPTAPRRSVRWRHSPRVPSIPVPRASIPFTATAWWERSCASSRRSRASGPTDQRLRPNGGR